MCPSNSISFILTYKKFKGSAVDTFGLFSLKVVLGLVILLVSQGVPVRVELGPRDLKQNQVVVVRRDTGAKSTLSLDGLTESLKALMEEIQSDLYAK